MIKNPKISVVIPVYNGERTLKQCLNSVLNQTYKNYEIIVVDNNSTDKTKEIIKEFKENNKRLRYIFEPKKGRGAARNAGINISIGKILTMTDSDCIVPQDWLEKISIPFIRYKENIVIGSEKEAVNNYWSKNIQKVEDIFKRKNSYGKYIYHLDTKNFAITSTLMKRFMFDENLVAVEDLDLYLRIRKCSKILFLNELKVIHFHKDSFSKDFRMHLDSGYWTYRVYRKYCKKRRVKDEMILQSFTLKNNILIIPFLLVKLIKNPEEFGFYLTSEISWRIGIIRSIFETIV
jgi:glycosyltransferase involved in cell wall biosynthesis